MKSTGIFALALLSLTLGGCATQGVVGTWTGRGDRGDAPFDFGSASFVGDRTFSAEARYGQNVRVQTGTWRTIGDELVLNANSQERRYSFQVEGDELTVRDPNTGNSITLDRVKP